MTIFSCSHTLEPPN